MFIDDDPINMIVAKKSFEHRNIEVIAASSGYEAMELFEKESGIDAVVTDIQLPGIDGIETMKKIKDTYKYKQMEVPFFAATAYSSAEDRHEFIDQGFNDVFIKPLDYDEIVNCIKMYL